MARDRQTELDRIEAQVKAITLKLKMAGAKDRRDAMRAVEEAAEHLLTTVDAHKANS